MRAKKNWEMELGLAVNSKINYNYNSLRLTQSRIDYGMLTVPRSLLFLFPNYSADISVFFNNSKNAQKKKFVVSEKNKEARIYGLSNWLKINKITPNDEIVIQVIDIKELLYRFIIEKKFVQEIIKYENKLDTVKNEEFANKYLKKIADINAVDEYNSSISQFIRLSKKGVPDRDLSEIRKNTKKSLVPVHFRVLLENIYKGRCQICNFSFLKKDGRPYFELHHILPNLAEHPKNICLVCANCHKQFTYAKVEHNFVDGWLSNVVFNDKNYKVKQIIHSLENINFYKNVYF